MDIRLLSLFKVQYQDGKEMDISETVTFFNNMCCLAPPTLIDKRIKRIEVEGNKVKASFTNNITVKAWLYFNEKGIKVPNQIAIIGFSNWFMSQVITPKLSTVDQPSYEMGVAAFTLLLEEILYRKEMKVFSPRTIELKTSIIVRESSLKNQLNCKSIKDMILISLS